MGTWGLRIDMGNFECHGAKRSAGGWVAAIAAMLVVTGCSSVPDYANPVEWYNSTVDFFDEDAPPPLAAETVPGSNDPYPVLADTPEPPLREIELDYLETIGEGLVADRTNAQYTDAVIRADGEAVIVEAPTFQEEAPAAPAAQPVYVPPPQPAIVQPAIVRPVVAMTEQSVAQPVLMQPVIMPLRTVNRGVDVQTMFANLFSSSGPSGVAPPMGGTQFIGGTLTSAGSLSGPSMGLPSSTTLISRGGGLIGDKGALFSSNKAAVIYFALGSTRITKEAHNALHKVIDYHKQNGGSLRVVGHASNRTKELTPERHELVNFNISFARARAVADELIRHGVGPDKLKVVALSDSAPAYGEWMPSGEAGNRRAEIFIDF